MRFLQPLAGGIIAACLAIAGATGADAPGTIHVISNGWHTGIIVAREDWPERRTPELADLGAAPLVEFGWGDREYYPASNPSLAMAFAAGFGANPAVIHLAGRGTLPRARGEVEILRLALAPDGFAAMVEEIDATFDRAGGARAERVAPGLLPAVGFYAATGRFSLANTCNTWVARMLASGGVALAPDGVVTAGQLMARLRELGAVAPAAE